MHPTAKRLCLTLVALCACVGSASAGILPSDPNAFLQGSKVFSGGNLLGQTLISRVEYGVYAPGMFGTSVALGLPAGFDPSGSTEYVYAYQIFNDIGGQLRAATLSVDLVPGVISNLAFVSHAAGTPAGGLAPTNWDFIPIAVNPPANVKWSFLSPNLLNTGLKSDILLFTSPLGPTFRNASLTGGSGSIAPPVAGPFVTLPSPTPEPSTLVLAASAVGLLAAGYLRRRRV
jgi:hypothetical protein